MNVSEDLYATLQVAPDADQRTIKAAYFALVRKHPPETDPEAFQRIRAAYEVLSDLERRAAYDSERADASRYGPEVHAVIRAAEDCLGRGDHEAARAMLQRLLHEQPGLHEARSVLAFAWLRGGDALQAAAEFRKLVAAEPEEAGHFLHLAWALSEAGQAEPALEAARHALSLSPSSGPAAATVGDVLATLGRKEEALRTWEEGRARAESRVDAVELHLRTLRLLLSIDPVAARRAFEALAKDVRAAGDRDLQRLASARVAGLAAGLYWKGALVPAGNLLDWAGELAFERTFEAAPPARVHVELDRLPEQSRQWVQKAQAEGAAPRRGAVVVPVALAVCACVVAAAMAASIAKGDARPMRMDDFVGWWMGWALSGAAIWFGARRAARARRVGRPGPWTLHPLWLVRADRANLEARPLLHLTDVRVTHQQANGTYSGTTVALHFGADSLAVSFRARRQAEEWAQSVHDQRQRTLQLLSGGLLQAEPGIALLPPETIAASQRAGGKLAGLRSAALQTAGVLAAAALLTIVSALLEPGTRERRSWASATTTGAIRQHLRNFPGSPHDAEARIRLSVMIRERIEAATKKAHRELPALRALMGAPLELAGIDLDLAYPRPAGIGNGLAAALTAADEHSAARLRSALYRALGPELINREVATRAAASLAVRFGLKDTGELFHAKGRAGVPAYEVSCEGEFKVGSARMPFGPWSFAPPASLTTSERALRAHPEAVVQEVVEAGRERCERALLEALVGRPEVIEAHSSPLVVQAVRSSSPYAHR